MNIKIIKGPRFEQQLEECFKYIRKVLIQKIKEEEQSGTNKKGA